MSTVRTILSIIPAQDGWTATHNDAGEAVVRPLVCWALVDSGGKRAVVPMVAIGREVVLCDDTSTTFVGTTPPAGWRAPGG